MEKKSLNRVRFALNCTSGRKRLLASYPNSVFIFLTNTKQGFTPLQVYYRVYSETRQLYLGIIRRKAMARSENNVQDYFTILDDEFADPYMKLSVAMLRQAVIDALEYPKVDKMWKVANVKMLGKNRYYKLKERYETTLDAWEFINSNRLDMFLESLSINLPSNVLRKSFNRIGGLL